MSTKVSKRLTKAGLYVVYAIVSLFFLFPILWVLSLSFKTVPELFEVPPSLLPDQIGFENYRHALVSADIFTYMLNSVKTVSATILGTLIIAIPAAYAFSRFRFKGKQSSLFVVLFFQMISPLIIVIPLYRYLGKLGLLNNFYSMVVVYIALMLPFATWTLKGYMDTVPRELDEAATIDGCSRFQTLYKILLPIVRPGVISVIIMVFVKSWAEFIVPFILLKDSRMFPISVGLVNLQSTADTITTHYLAAASIIAITPTIIIFILLQRFIVSAMTAGAVKE